MAIYKTYTRRRPDNEVTEILLVRGQAGEAAVDSIKHRKAKDILDGQLISEISDNISSSSEYVGPPSAVARRRSSRQLSGGWETRPTRPMKDHKRSTMVALGSCREVVASHEIIAYHDNLFSEL